MNCIKILSFSLVGLISLWGCQDAPLNIKGKWVLPIQGAEDSHWGFELKEDSNAVSINTSTLQYQKWSLKKDTLILFGQSIGIGQTIEFSDTLIVKKINSKILTLERTNGFQFNYTKID